jgi:hypothetical protein
VPIVLKSGSLNLPEPSGPVKACNGIAFILFLTVIFNHGGLDAISVILGKKKIREKRSTTQTV